MEYFNFLEFEKVLEYSMVEEGMTVKLPDKDKAIKSIAKETAEDPKSKKSGKGAPDEIGEFEITDKSGQPKDVRIKALAKNLYKAQYKAITMQKEIDDAIVAMTDADPEDPEIATATANGALQVANAQLLADTIEERMIAVAADNEKMVQLATELSAEAKNLALKSALDKFGKVVLKWKKDAESKLKDKEKEEKEAGEKSAKPKEEE